MGYPVKRKLDTMYFRVERDGKWQNLCFTDLTPKEQESMTKEWTDKAWQRFGLYMANRLRELGDALDVGRVEEEPETGLTEVWRV